MKHVKRITVAKADTWDDIANFFEDIWSQILSFFDKDSK